MSDCLPCDLEDASEAQVVLRDDTWSCEVAEGYDVPGWFIVRLRRHAEGWDGPRTHELAGFGPFAQRVATALQATTGSPLTYLLSFGENYPHFHFLLVDRPADLALEHVGANLLARREQLRDRDAALSTAAEVRSALQDAVPAT